MCFVCEGTTITRCSHPITSAPDGVSATGNPNNSP